MLIGHGSNWYREGKETAMNAYKKDYYFQKAKKEDYPARSVYKLQEIEKRHKIFKSGMRVLDLGAYPGSWTLYAAQRVGTTGMVVAVDRESPSVSFPQQVIFLQGDVLEPGAQLVSECHGNGPYDLVLSDMAPQTTGIKIRDQALSYELAEKAFEICQDTLVRKGHFVVKIFEGPDVPQYRSLLRKSFSKLKTVKPKSSRRESKEVFLVGLDFQPLSLESGAA